MNNIEFYDMLEFSFFWLPVILGGFAVFILFFMGEEE